MIEAGEDPRSERAEALVARSWALWHQDSGADPEIKAAIKYGNGRAYHDRQNWPHTLRQRWEEFRMNDVGRFLGAASMAAFKRRGVEFYATILGRSS